MDNTYFYYKYIQTIIPPTMGALLWWQGYDEVFVGLVSMWFCDVSCHKSTWSSWSVCYFFSLLCWPFGLRDLQLPIPKLLPSESPSLWNSSMVRSKHKHTLLILLFSFIPNSHPISVFRRCRTGHDRIRCHIRSHHYTILSIRQVCRGPGRHFKELDDWEPKG